MKTPSLLLALSLALVFAKADLSAQGGCIDPPATGSFILHSDQLYTMSDGYQCLVDIRIPETNPGSCGWPIILLIHGSGFDKSQLIDDAEIGARQGYLTICYDVRGQGTSMQLNDPSIYGRGPLGLRERLDMFEVLEETENRFPSFMDMDRVGVTGKSQGAYLTWCAIAHSGKLPPANPWRTAPFPSIAAACPRNSPPDLKNGVFPNAVAVTEKHVKALYSPISGVHHDPAFFATVDSLMVAEDYQTLFDIPSDPALDVVELLKTSDVPTRATVAYDDVHFQANWIVEVWDAILPNSPKMLNITTGGHSTPENRKEEGVRRLRFQQWFNRFLRGHQNGVENTPEFRMSIRPQDPLEFQDLLSIWDYREFASWPPPTTDNVLWLNDNGRLKDFLNTSGSGFIHHQWQTSYTMADYTMNVPTAVDLQSKIPLQDLRWETDPLTEDQTLLGSANATVWVATPDQDFQVHLALYDVKPNGEDMYVCGGTKTVRGNTQSTAQALDIDLNIYGYTFQKGNTIQLRVENLAWTRPPGGGELSTFREVPVFSDFDIQVLYGGATPSVLNLPVMPNGDVNLVCSDVKLPRGRLRDLSLRIFSDSDHHNLDYFILAGKSGIFPGSSWHGLHLELNQDALTRAIINNIGILPLTGFTGKIGADGRAFAQMAFQTGGVPSWYLPELDFVAVVYASTSVSQASPPVVLNRF